VLLRGGETRKCAPAGWGHPPELLLRGGDARQSCACGEGAPENDFLTDFLGTRILKILTFLGAISKYLNVLSDLSFGLNYKAIISKTFCIKWGKMRQIGTEQHPAPQSIKDPHC
jgi:hypothetical protein